MYLSPPFEEKNLGQDPSRCRQGDRVHGFTMTSMDKVDALRQLAASGLRGRGGAWFEAHRKWRAVLSEGSPPVVIANGGEGEPGSIKDRFIMRTRTADVLAGLDLARRTLGAAKGFVYLKGSFEEENRTLQAAIDTAGLAGTITIHRGDDTYVGGEETALLESIEGRVAWPRPKPPRPASVGLFGGPTLVQNVDTLARVSAALRLGADFGEVDTLTLTLWGDVQTPGAYEVGIGRTIASVIETEGGGATGPIGLVFPNGAHSLPLGPNELDTLLDPMALAARGTALGAASILVLEADTSAYSIIESIARFFERESCGQCPPCVLGTANLRSLVTGDRPPTIRLNPQTALRETASFMSMHGYCGHSRAGATAVSALFARFESEIMARLRGDAAPSGMRDRDPFAPGSAERAALDAFLRRL